MYCSASAVWMGCSDSFGHLCTPVRRCKRGERKKSFSLWDVSVTLVLSNIFLTTAADDNGFSCSFLIWRTSSLHFPEKWREKEKKRNSKKRRGRFQNNGFPRIFPRLSFGKKEKKIRNRISQILNFRATEQVMGKRCSYARFKSREGKRKGGFSFLFFRAILLGEITVCRLKDLKKKSL